MENYLVDLTNDLMGKKHSSYVDLCNMAKSFGNSYPEKKINIFENYIEELANILWREHVGRMNYKTLGKIIFSVKTGDIPLEYYEFFKRKTCFSGIGEHILKSNVAYMLAIIIFCRINPPAGYNFPPFIRK